MALVRSASQSKWVAVFGFLAFLSLYVPYLLRPLIVLKTLKAMPALLPPALDLAGFLLASVFLYFLLLAIFNQLEENTATVRTDIRALFGCVLLFLLNYMIYGICANYVVPYYVSINFSLGLLNSGPWFIFYGVMSLILLMVLLIALIASIMCVAEQQSGFRPLRSLQTALIFFLKHAVSLIFYGVAGALLFFALKYLGAFILDRLPIPALLAYLYQGALAVSLGEFCYVSLAAIICGKVLPTGRPGAVQAGNAGWLAPALLFAVILAAGAYFNFLQTPSLASVVDRAIADDARLAEQYANDGQYDLSGYYYKRSYVHSQAMIGYLKALIISRDPSFTGDAKGKAQQEVAGIFYDAYQANPTSGFYYYLNDLSLQNLNQTGGQIANMEMASEYLPGFPNPLLDLLELYSKNHDRPNTAKTFDRLVKQGAFTACNLPGRASLSGLNDLYKKYEQVSQASMKRLPVTAMFYYENRMYDEASAELNVLSKAMPDEPSVNYLLAMVDLQMNQDNKQYDVAQKAADKIYSAFPGQKWAVDFKTLVASRSGNNAEYQQVLQQSYENNPGDADIAEQYAYSLMKDNASFSMTEADQKAEQILDQVVQQDDTRWFAYYCKAVLDLKKPDYAGSLDNLAKFSSNIINEPDLLPYYDDFYYLYVLKYETYASVPAAAAALDGIKSSDPFAYNYIYGAYYWSKKDFANATACLQACIDLNNTLSKPYFLLGNVYFEHGYLSHAPEDYTTALAEYKTALSIFNDDPYCWFALGHVYKDMNRLQDALGAFQKALYNMPHEDHNQDHFGVSIHSQMQIDEIKSKLNP